jgi:hypothetical protein
MMKPTINVKDKGRRPPHLMFWSFENDDKICDTNELSFLSHFMLPPKSSTHVSCRITAGVKVNEPMRRPHIELQPAPFVCDDQQKLNCDTQLYMNVRIFC